MNVFFKIACAKRHMFAVNQNFELSRFCYSTSVLPAIYLYLTSKKTTKNKNKKPIIFLGLYFKILKAEKLFVKERFLICKSQYLTLKTVCFKGIKA